ncbi:lipopolysaccharide biosynthesis protein [Devosia sp. RR2S18]|uniref:lipopolysaccharide biosynthesis protein n=1 Tax=Devosia rhizosphaerae TaxID=3049774 RepID=UPI00253F750F|nr:hypothetical protein [Devosia sp. RR2S18]WIJ23909.1 hypothetical protein QOV41_12730 [Devosia sp. RR2S18]
MSKRVSRLTFVGIDQLVVSGGNFVTLALIARRTEMADFGIFAMIISGLLFLQGLVSAGISSPMQSLAPKYGSASWVRSFYFMVQLKTATVVLAAAALSVLMPLPSYAVVVLSFAAISQMQEFLRKLAYMDGDAAVSLSSSFIRHVAVVLGVLASQERLELHSIFSLFLLSSAISLLPFKRYLYLLSGASGGKHEIVNKTLRYVSWNVPSSILHWANGQFFIVATGIWVGVEAAAIMRAAQSILGLTHVGFHAAENILPPSFSRALNSGGLNRLRAKRNRFILLSVCCMLIAGVLLVVPSEYLLRVVFGEEYSGYSWVVQVIFLKYLLMSVALPLRLAFLAREWTQKVFSSYALGGVVTLCSIPLIWWGGIAGASAGYVGAQLIATAYLFRVGR